MRCPGLTVTAALSLNLDWTSTRMQIWRDDCVLRRSLYRDQVDAEQERPELRDFLSRCLSHVKLTVRTHDQLREAVCRLDS